MSQAPVAFLLVGVLATACATSQPQDAARDFYRDYAEACADHKEDRARERIAVHREVPCPDPEDMPPAELPSVILVAQRGELEAYRDDKWHIVGGFELDSPQAVLRHLRYAIKARDAARIARLLAQNADAQDIQTWLQSPRANEIYAGLAMQPDPRIEIQDNTASCAVAGHTLTLEYDKTWTIRALP